MIHRCKVAARYTLVATVLLLLGSRSQADFLEWKVEPDRSSFTISGSIIDGTTTLASLSEQAPGSLIATAAGKLVTEFDTIQNAPVGLKIDIAQSLIYGEQLNTWAPQFGGEPGTELAVVGGVFDFGPSAGTLTAAIRYLEAFFLTESYLQMIDQGNGLYTVSSDFEFAINGHADLLGEGPLLGVLFGQSSQDVFPEFVANDADLGTLQYQGGLITLNLPVNVTLLAPLASGLEASLTITGTLVATAVVPEVSSASLLTLGLLAGVWANRRRRLGK